MSKKTVSFTEDNPQVFEYEQTELPPELKKEKGQSQERKDWFVDVMSVSFGITIPKQVLDEISFEGVAKFIADGKCCNIITMAGAGISTSAGIPDYRSPGTGLMDVMKVKYPNIQNVSDLFNIQFFLKDPESFFERSRRFFEISLKPTPCHYFVRLLHEKGLLLRHFTQNIDTLERLAGLPGDKVVEAHGSYYTSHCILCDEEYSFTWMEDRVLKGEIPKCEAEDCTGVIKPDIVMFGESLPERFGECAEEDTLKCDLLIIMGTALAVQPFASLTSKVKTSTPRLYINIDRGQTGKKHPMTDIMFGGSFYFDCEDNVRDVFKQGKCDEAIYAMADIIGWGEELRTLVKSEHDRIDDEDKNKGKLKASSLTDFAETSTDLLSTVANTDPSESREKTTPEKSPLTTSSNPAKTSSSNRTKAKECSPRANNKAAVSDAKSSDVKGSNDVKGTSHSKERASGHGVKRVTSTTVSSGKSAAGSSGQATPRSKASDGAVASTSASSRTAGGPSAARPGVGAKNSSASPAKGKQPVTTGNKAKPGPSAGK